MEEVTNLRLLTRILLYSSDSSLSSGTEQKKAIVVVAKYWRIHNNTTFIRQTILSRYHYQKSAVAAGGAI